MDFCGSGTRWREVGEEIVVLAGVIENSNFHFFPPLSHILLKFFLVDSLFQYRVEILLILSAAPFFVAVALRIVLYR